MYVTIVVLITRDTANIISGMKLHHAKRSLNRDCLEANKGDEWKCLLAKVSVAILFTRIMPNKTYACSTCLNTSKLLYLSSIQTMT